MSHIGIPTICNGYRMRSLLEAKWASFFTLLGWPWVYEPFELDGWIPDFLIKGENPVLVEVKPLLVGQERDKISAAAHTWKADILLVASDSIGGVVDDPSLPAIGELWEFMQWDGLQGWDDEGHGVLVRVDGSGIEYDGWPVAQIGLAHEHQSYQDRITGRYNGGLGGVSVDEVHALWAAASNATQWRPPAGGRA